MKTASFSFFRVATAILVVAALIAAGVSFAQSKKQNTAPTPQATGAMNVQLQEEQLLVQRLLDDKQVDAHMGFLIEKKGNSLFIDGKETTDAVANAYLQGITQRHMRIQRFSTNNYRIQTSSELMLAPLRLPGANGDGC